MVSSSQKCFDTSSRSKEEAIEHAHLKRNLKTAAKEGDVTKVKEQLKATFKERREDEPQQLTWAKIKFPQKSD